MKSLQIEAELLADLHLLKRILGTRNMTDTIRHALHFAKYTKAFLKEKSKLMKEWVWLKLLIWFWVFSGYLRSAFFFWACSRTLDTSMRKGRTHSQKKVVGLPGRQPLTGIRPEPKDQKVEIEPEPMTKKEGFNPWTIASLHQVLYLLISLMLSGISPKVEGKEQQGLDNWSP